MQNSLFNVVSEGVTTNDYYTPKWLFDALGLEFDIDVAAPVYGIPWIPAKRWFSQADDGLAQDWGGDLVWMNPPFSDCSPWVNKFIQNNNGIALLPTSKSAWFHHIWEKADSIVALSSNYKLFIRPNGQAKAVFMPVMLFSLGKTSCNALSNCKLGRVR